MTSPSLLSHEALLPLLLPSCMMMRFSCVFSVLGSSARAGAVSAPRYRQASLYTRLTLREDARDARAFAYQDIVAAFEAWLERHS